MSVSHFGFSSARDLLDACKRFNEKYREDGNVDDLIAAVMMGAHISDWIYYKGFSDRSDGQYSAHQASMASLFPEWDVVRKIANGVKHPKKKNIVDSKKRQCEWEDLDFWDVGGLDNDTYFIEIDGEQRSIYSIVDIFCKNLNSHLEKNGM